MQLLLV